jgi:hypothetical protein
MVFMQVENHAPCRNHLRPSSCGAPRGNMSGITLEYICIVKNVVCCPRQGGRDILLVKGRKTLFATFSLACAEGAHGARSAKAVVGCLVES